MLKPARIIATGSLNMERGDPTRDGAGGTRVM